MGKVERREGLKLHPLYKYYLALEEKREKYLRELEEVKPRLEEAEAKLEKLKRELILEYGPGSFKTKTVRNKVGKKYRYLVWVTIPDGKEHYLPKEALEYWDSRKKLKAYVELLEREIRELSYRMKPLEYYVDICIDQRKMTYVRCSTGEPILPTRIRID